MGSNKTNKDENLEKELRSLVLQMKDETAALNKILAELKFREDETPVKSSKIKSIKSNKE
jgi:hypothetical protein